MIVGTSKRFATRIKGFNPAQSVPGATLFTGSLEVRLSGVGTSHYLIRAAYPLSFRSAAPQPR